MRTFVWTVVLSLMLIFAWSPVSADTTPRLSLNRTNSADLNATIDAIDAGTAWMGQDLTIDPVVETNTPSVVFQDGDNTDDDDNVTLDTACTTTTTGAEDCDLTITQQVAGTAKNAAVFDADLNIAFMPQNVLDVINNATGNVDITLRDYADTTDDDQAHTILRTDCTTATTGAEDCDFTILVPEAGAAPVLRFTIDADGGTTIGAATNDLVTITTDSTGDGELVVPADSIGILEIDSAACNQILWTAVNPTEASATDDFASFFDHAGSTSEAAEDDFFAIGNAWTAHTLNCTVDVAPGAGQDPWILVLRDDGADTALTCTIDETATACTDSSNTPTVAVNSLINMSISSVGSDADPTAAALLTCRVCLGY